MTIATPATLANRSAVAAALEAVQPVTAGVTCVRIYEVELGPSPAVRLELDLTDGSRTMEAQIWLELFDSHALTIGRRVYVSPTNVGLFPRMEAP